MTDKANEIARKLTTNDAAYGSAEHPTVKTKAVKDDGIDLNQIVMGLVAFAIAVFIALVIYGVKFAPLMR